MNIAESQSLKLRGSGYISYPCRDEAENATNPVSIAIVGQQPPLRHGIKQIVDGLEYDVDTFQMRSIKQISDYYDVVVSFDAVVLFKHIGDNDFYHNLALFLNSKESSTLRVIVISDMLGQSDWKHLDRGVVDLFLPMKVDVSLVGHLLDLMLSENPINRESFRNWTSVLRKEFMPDICDLSQKELRVMSHLQHGICNKAIASELNITESTVKSHLTSIYKKLGVSGRLHIALLAHRQYPLAYGQC